MELLRKNWWVLAFQGLLIFLLGALAILMQDFTLKQLVIYLGITLIIFGLLMLLGGWISGRRGSNWFGLLLFGLLQVIVGSLILFNSDRATGIFTITIGLFAVLMGVIQIILGFGNSRSRILYFINGAVSATLGLILLFYPSPELQLLTYLIGFYSLMLGFFVIYYSVKLRNMRPEPGKPSKPQAKNSSDRAGES